MKNYNAIFLKTLAIFIFIFKGNDNSKIREEECEYNIHRRCNVDQCYTEQEVENVRLYLIKRFAITNPIRKPCAKLRVRKDIKCLSKKELNEFITVFKKLYANGVIDRYTYLHKKYWAEAHKFAEGLQWHKWFENELENEMQKINPNVTLPYWENYSEFKEAEKSLVWKYFGHAGNKNNDYVVTDGYFANALVNNPDRHYVRRQWNKDGTLPPWEAPEWITAVFQMGTIPLFAKTIPAFFQAAFGSLPDLLRLLQTLLGTLTSNCGKIQLFGPFSIFIGIAGHFKPHLSMGGYNGDLSLQTAPNDVVFWLFHTYLDYSIIKWQLQCDENLVPQTYNFGFKIDAKTQQISLANIDTDNLTYYENITVKETFQMGYGEMCYIYDHMIKPINDIIMNKKPKLPIAVKRLKAALPREKFELYFPKFAFYKNKYVSPFDYLLPEVGSCNPIKNGVCKKMPIAERYNATPNGIRQLNIFNEDPKVIDPTSIIFETETFYEQFMNDLNTYNYCSPYV